MGNVLGLLTILSLHVYLNDSTPYDLCIHQCDHDDFPWECSSSTCAQTIYKSASNCTLFGSQPFGSKRECELYANQQSPASLYCEYMCNRGNYTATCVPPGQVCPFKYKECDMFGEAQKYSSLDHCYHQSLYNESFDTNATIQLTNQEKTKYIMVFNKLNWTSAEKYCRTTYDSHLATIISDRDFAVIKQLRTMYYWDIDIWIGLNDRDAEAQFKWSDGTVCANNRSHIGCIPRNRWMKGEPNNYRIENCGVLPAQHNFINDVDCSNELIFMCQNNTIDGIKSVNVRRGFILINHIIISIISVISVVVCIVIARQYYICIYLKTCKLCGAWCMFADLWEQKKSKSIHDEIDSTNQTSNVTADDSTVCGAFSHNDSKVETERILQDLKEIEEGNDEVQFIHIV